MNWAETRNLQPLSLADIPEVPVDLLRASVIERAAADARVVQFFAMPAGPRMYRLIAVLAIDSRSKLLVGSALVGEGRSYRSFTGAVPQMHLFEREIHEESGIVPEGHPWLKPVRNRTEGCELFHSESTEIHEVGVGPIHAGVIEPGHFRFLCRGEEILNLEIALGYQHRGVEGLILTNRDRSGYLVRLAESIAGDTVLGHCGAHLRAVEALSGVIVSRRAQAIRTVGLELERIGNHLGDLSALANDVAYLTGSSAFGALRTRVINSTMLICGSRFGRDFYAPGGVHFDIAESTAETILETLAEVEAQAELSASVMFTSPSLLSRFEKTGVVSTSEAAEMGMVGPAARASGVAIDVRADHPFGGYVQFPVHTLTLRTGDVYARAYMRYAEISQSIDIIREQIENLEPGDLESPPGVSRPRSMVVSMAEGWRGEIVHTVVTDDGGGLARYKITDPSFHNWQGLAAAVRGNGISDFPLCNKSFNLSYCGFDL